MEWPGRILFRSAKLSRDARVQLSFGARNVAHQRESALPVFVAKLSFYKKASLFGIEPHAMELVNGHGLAISEMEYAHQFPTRRAQECIFVRAPHFGKNHSGHDGNEDDYDHQFD